MLAPPSPSPSISFFLSFVFFASNFPPSLYFLICLSLSTCLFILLFMYSYAVFLPNKRYSEFLCISSFHFTHAHANKDTHIRTYIRPHTDTHTHIHAYTRSPPPTHTYTHAHTRAPTRKYALWRIYKSEESSFLSDLQYPFSSLTQKI